MHYALRSLAAVALVLVVVRRPAPVEAQFRDTVTLATTAMARYLAGSGDDDSGAIAMDSAGNLYVTGRTASRDFPTPSPQPTHALEMLFHGYVTKVNASGTTVYSRSLEGTPTSIAVDRAGNAYVAVMQGPLVVTKINAQGTDVVYATSLEARLLSCCPRLAVTDAGEVVGGGRDDYNAFVAMLDAAGRPTFATRLGPGGAEDLALDPAGMIYVAGTTTSMDFPTTPGAFQPEHRGPAQCGDPSFDGPRRCANAFVTKIDPKGPRILYSTFAGTAAADSVHLAVDAVGRAFLTAAGTLGDGPTAVALAPACAPPEDGCSSQTFIARLSASGSAIEYVATLTDFSASAIAVDAHGQAHVAGWTGSNTLPARRAVQTQNGGGPILTTSDDGVTWQPASAGLTTSAVDMLTVSRRPPYVAFAATSRGIFRSDDQARHWSSAGLNDQHVFNVVVDPQTPAIVYAATAGALFKSLDSGANWTTITPRPFGLKPFSLSIAPSNPSTLYLDSVEGLLKSTDGGSTWRQTSGVLTLAIGSIVVDAREAETLYAVTGGGVIRSRDGATTWSAPTRPSACGGAIAGLRSDPAMPSTLFGFGAGVFRSMDGGATWTDGIGLRCSSVINSVTLNPSNASTIYASGTEGLYKSTDGGVSWTAVSSKLSDLLVTVADPARRGVLYGSPRADMTDGFVAILNASGTSLLAATYLGGVRGDAVSGLALDVGGSVALTGATRSREIPVVGARPAGLPGTTDGFVVVFGAAGPGRPRLPLP